MQSRAKRSRSEEGAVEGLPLQLMIVAIVAGLALATVLSWTLAIPAPNVFHEVRADPTSVPISGFEVTEEARRSLTITVVALDANGRPIPDIVVTLQGAGVFLVGADGDDQVLDGSVKFSRTQVRLAPHEATATILVTVEKAGFATAGETTIVVYRG